MVDYKDYLDTLNSCDANTICSVFDVSLLRELYLSMTGEPISESQDIREMAVIVKTTASLIVFPVHNMSAEELMHKYSKSELVQIWKCLYKIPCYKRKIEDIAWDIREWYVNEERTADLTKLLR